LTCGRGKIFVPRIVSSATTGAEARAGCGPGEAGHRLPGAGNHDQDCNVWVILNYAAITTSSDSLDDSRSLDSHEISRISGLLSELTAQPDRSISGTMDSVGKQ
jgi:hypothetical protein